MGYHSFVFGLTTLITTVRPFASEPTYTSRTASANSQLVVVVLPLAAAA
jgi:hypothetical protein